MTEIGVAYHSTTPNFRDDYFLTQYHRPGYRAEVLQQLAQIKAAGADFLNLRIWIGADGTRDITRRPAKWMMSFPPSAQEMANFRRYVRDVDQIGLPLDVSLQWTWLAESAEGDFEEGLGHDRVHPDDYSSRMRDGTLRPLIGSVEPGQVRTWTFDGEIVLHPEPEKVANPFNAQRYINSAWQVAEGYGYMAWLLTRAGKGEPSIDLLTLTPGEQVLDDEWHGLKDHEYPAVSGHRTAYWMYRGLEALRTIFRHGRAGRSWPDHWWPRRAMLKLYSDVADPIDIPPFLSRVVGDAGAVLPNFGMERIGIAETNHYLAGPLRDAHAEAMMQLAIDRFTLWSTPYKQHRINLGNEMAGPITDLKAYLDAREATRFEEAD